MQASESFDSLRAFALISAGMVESKIMSGINAAGLCASCKYLKLVRSERGSEFVMCLRSKADPSFRKYPPLPVLACRGYERLRGD